MPQESINRIVTIIASNLKREMDEPFKRILAVRVDYWRSTLISRSLEKHPDQRNFFTQTIWVPMECHSLIPCPTPMTLCNVMRSRVFVPIPMRFGTTLFDYVGSIDGENAFQIATVGTHEIMTHSRYTGGDTYWEYTNKKILIRNNKHNYAEKPLPMIRVDGVFDKPLDVMAFNCTNADAACDYWNDPYPVTNDILQMITQYILQIDFKPGNDKDTSNPPEIEEDPNNPRNG